MKRNQFIPLMAVLATVFAGKPATAEFDPMADMEVMGDIVGNGGDVLGCWETSPQGFPVLRYRELLDYYETRELRGITIDLGGPGLTMEERIELVISRFEPRDPDFAALLRKRAAEFMSEAVLLADSKFTDIPDSYHLVLPKDCEIVQAAIQIQPQFPEDKRFLINKDVWDHLNSETQAGLVLHEIIYQQAIERGAKNSISSRYFNGYLAGNRLGGMTLAQYADFWRRLKGDWGTHHYRYLRWTIELADTQFYEDGSVKRVDLPPGVPATVTQQGKEVGLHVTVQHGTELEFHDNGRIASYAPAKEVTYQMGRDTVSFLGSHSIFVRAIRLHSDGDTPAVGELLDPAFLTVKSLNGSKLQFRGRAEFHPNGSLRRAMNVNTHYYIDRAGSQKKVEHGRMVIFDEEGYFLGVEN